MCQYDPNLDFKINVDHSDLNFTVQRFSLISSILKNVLCFTIILSDNESYDPKFDLKMNVGHSDLYFTVQ